MYPNANSIYIIEMYSDEGYGTLPTAFTDENTAVEILWNEITMNYSGFSDSKDNIERFGEFKQLMKDSLNFYRYPNKIIITINGTINTDYLEKIIGQITELDLITGII